MADFDIKAARDAGYSDVEIADHLAAQRGFDVQAARQSGYGDKEILGHLSPPPSFGRRAMDAVGEGATAVARGGADVADWLATRGNKVAANTFALPTTISRGFDWASEKTGIPKAAFGPAAWMTEIAGQPGMPGPAEYETLLRDNPYLNVGPAAVLQHGARAIKGGTSTPEINLPGRVGKVVDTGAEGVLAAALTGGASVPALMAGAFGGAGSEVGGELAEGTPYEIPARILGAVAGGVGGAVAPSVARKVGGAVTAARAPFTAAGRERLVGTALRDAAADPDAAIASLDRYTIGREAFPDAVPGFRIDAGKAARDPGLMAVAETAKPARPAMGMRVQENNRLVTEALDRAQSGLPPASTAGETIQTALAGRKDALEATRKAVTDPMYTAVREFPEDLPVGRLFQYTAKAIAENKGEAKTIMERAQKLLLDSKGRPDFSAQGLVAARTEIGDMLSSPTLGKHAKELLIGMRQQVDEVMQTVPQAREATTTFREMSRPLDPFNPKLGETERTIARVVDRGPYGGNFTMPAEKVPKTLMRPGGLSAPQVQKIMTAAGGDKTIKQAMASSYLDDFRSAAAPVAQDAAGNPMMTAAGAARWLKANRGGAANVLTPEQIGALDDITRHLTDQAQTVPGRVGSPTFDRLASESILSALIGRKEVPAWMHPIQKALTLNGIIDIYGGANKQMLDRVLDVISDPAMTAALMKKATPGNVKMVEPLLLQFGRGTAAGGLPTLGERGTP